MHPGCEWRRETQKRCNENLPQLPVPRHTHALCLHAATDVLSVTAATITNMLLRALGNPDIKACLVFSAGFCLAPIYIFLLCILNSFPSPELSSRIFIIQLPVEHKKRRCILELGLGSSAFLLEPAVFLKGCLILQVSSWGSDRQLGSCIWCWNSPRLWSRPELETLV